jgi:penicillin amidase
MNPKNGLIVNWNNKPTPWWENADTPAWGAIFRNQVLADQLRMPKIGIEDIELAAWKIARAEEDGAFLMPFIHDALKAKPDLPALRYLAAYDGLALAGSIGARIYRAVVQATREELFLSATGNMLSMDLFNQAAQPSVMLKALTGRTKFDYLAKRRPVEIVGKAIDIALQRLKTSLGPDLQAWRFVPGSIAVADGPPIPYSNRGSYIQIIELAETVRGRNVLPPGVSESGPHASDQVGLARAWLYKPMRAAPKP